MGKGYRKGDFVMSDVCESSIRETILSFGKHASTLVELTIKDSEKYIEEMEEAIVQGNPMAAGLAAHALKSIMRQIQATDLSEIAFDIEKNGKDGNLARCIDLADSLRESWKKTRIILASFLSSPPSS